MIQELPRRGDIATEFRNLSGSISEEVFSTVYPNIHRLLMEYRENSENTFSETNSGTRSIELTSGRLENSLNDMIFELEKLKRYQENSLELLENLKGHIDDSPSANFLLGKMLGNVFKGARRGARPAGKKPAATKVETKGKVEEKTKTKGKAGSGLFTKGLNIIAVAYAVYDAIERISKLDPADPDYNKKATQEVAAVVARFGAATVGAVAGAILGSGVPFVGNVVGFAAGLAGGLFVDYYYGDNVEEITKNIIEKIWAKEKTKSNIPTNRKLASLGMPSGNVFTNQEPKQSSPVSININTGSSIINATDDDVTVAKDIMFGARKMKFIGDKLLFTNVIGIEGGKGKAFKIQSRQQNKPSEKIEELKQKSEDSGASTGTTTPASGGGGVTPSSPITGSSGGGMGGSTGPSGYNPSGSGVNVTGNAEEAMQFFMSKGWSREQAAGIVGNLMVESGNFSPDVLSGKVRGDGGKAFGVAQWHPPRQAKFKEVYGKPIEQATFQEQLEFVNWELNNSHKNAGAALRATNDPAQAAEIVDRFYEISSGIHRYQRMNNAVGIIKNQKTPQTSNTAPSSPTAQSQPAVPVSTTPSINANQLREASTQAVTVPVEDPEKTKQSLQQIFTNNQTYNLIGQDQQKSTTTVADVSVKERLMQSFAH